MGSIAVCAYTLNDGSISATAASTVCHSGWSGVSPHAAWSTAAGPQNSTISAVVRMVFLESSLTLAKERLREVADQLRGRFPDAARLIEDAEEDVLAFMHFPLAHWSKLCSTSPLERLNREIARRIDVVSIFPNRASLLRLTTAYLQERDEEWLTERRYMSLGSLSKITTDALAPVSGNFIA